ncbi:MAG: sodium:solute symporter [Campylobacterota bacterium]|nr:sodium:solute symporter [Campylobacterota bacterium]
MGSHTGLFILFFVIFSAVYIILGYISFLKTKTEEDWLIAGGKMSGFFVAFSYGATFISAVALIGFAGAGSLFGQGLLWLSFLNIFVGIFIAFVFFGFRTRKMGRALNALTMPGLIGNRFNSRGLQAVSGAIIALFAVSYTTAVFLAIGSLIEVTFGIPYRTSILVFTIIVAVYLLAGGLRAVMWTDAIQGVLMLILMVVLYFWIYIKLGGITAAHDQAAALTAAELAKIGSPAAKLAPNGLTSLPPFGSVPFMILLSLICGVGIGVLAQPQLVIRYLTAKSERALAIAVPLGGIFILCMTFAAFSIGPLADIFFVKNAIMYPGTPDKVIPLLLNKFFPFWFVFLFLFGILAAAMSTCDSLFHVVGASIARDIYDKGIMGGKVSSTNALRINRLATAMIIIATLALSLKPPAAVAIMCTFFFGLMGSTFLAVYTLSLYWKRMTKTGAWAGILSGFLTTVIWYSFIFYKTAPKISGLKIAPPIGYLDPLFIAIPLSFLLTWLVSLITKPLPEELINKAFKDI